MDVVATVDFVINTTVMDVVIATVLVIIKALNAAFLVSTAIPLCGPSLWTPPGRVDAAVNVTVATNVAITMRVPAISLRLLSRIDSIIKSSCSRIPFNFLACFALTALRISVVRCCNRGGHK